MTCPSLPSQPQPSTHGTNSICAPPASSRKTIIVTKATGGVGDVHNLTRSMIASGQSLKRERMVRGGLRGNAVRMTSGSTRAHDLGMESLCLSWPAYVGLRLKACVKM